MWVWVSTYGWVQCVCKHMCEYAFICVLEWVHTGMCACLLVAQELLTHFQKLPKFSWLHLQSHRKLTGIASAHHCTKFCVGSNRSLVPELSQPAWGSSSSLYPMSCQPFSLQWLDAWQLHASKVEWRTVRWPRGSYKWALLPDDLLVDQMVGRNSALRPGLCWNMWPGCYSKDV